jgi:inosine/xanthosine triphosphatase
MELALGSENPVKVAATERAAERFGGRVTALGVDSGVSDQPTGHDETRQGAEQRAVRARGLLDRTVPDPPVLGVGLEGGVAPVEDGRWLVMWAAVTDGDRWGRGTGPGVALPDRVARRVADGEELGPVVDDLLGENGTKHGQGAAGAFSGGLIDRESALVAALAGALGPFVTGYYD